MLVWRVCVFVVSVRYKIPHEGRIIQIKRFFLRRTKTVSLCRKDYLRCIQMLPLCRGKVRRSSVMLLRSRRRCEIQLKILDSYFDKLREDCDDRTARLDEKNVLQSRRGLNSLEDYLERLNQGIHSLDFGCVLSSS